MSKALVGWCSVVILLTGLLAIAPLVAQESASSAASSSSTSTVRKPAGKRSQLAVRSDSIRDAEERIDYVLDQSLRTPLSYEEESLNFVLEALSDEYEIPIVFDKAALDEVTISPEAEISINVRGISLRSALNLIFKEPGLEDLEYAIADEVLLITTEERSNEMLVATVYRVDDLVTDPQSVSKSNKLVPVEFIDMVISCIEHDSWMENGTGSGEIRYLTPGMIVVSQSRHVQRQIKDLLEQIRSTKRHIISDKNSH